jgi:hypothetical protein
MNPDRKLWIPIVWNLVALAACVPQFPSFVRNLRPRPEEMPDFYQEWASARNYFEGMPIYSPHSISSLRYSEALHLPPGSSLHGLMEYNAHPPTSVLLALPLARLDFSDAFFAWSLLSLLALLASILLMARQCPHSLSWWAILPVTALLLWCSPFRQQIIMGQLNLLLLFLLTAAWAAYRSERLWTAGILLGCATAIKLVPGFLFLYFVVRRQWRPIVGGNRSQVELDTVILSD